MAFTLSKKIELGSVLGLGHESDYLVFKPVTFKDAKTLNGIGASAEGESADQTEQIEKAVEFMRSKFIAGKITDEETKSQVDVEETDVEDLPIDVLTYCMRQLSGTQTANFTEN